MENVKSRLSRACSSEPCTKKAKSSSQGRMRMPGPVACSSRRPNWRPRARSAVEAGLRRYATTGLSSWTKYQGLRVHPKLSALQEKYSSPRVVSRPKVKNFWSSAWMPKWWYASFRSIENIRSPRRAMRRSEESDSKRQERFLSNLLMYEKLSTRRFLPLCSTTKARETCENVVARTKAPVCKQRSASSVSHWRSAGELTGVTPWWKGGGARSVQSHRTPSWSQRSI